MAKRAHGKRHGTKSQTRSIPGMTRRDFGKLLMALGAMGYIDERRVALALETDETRLGWLSNQDPGREGIWDATDIEGEIPPELDGTVYRTGPGQTSNHDVVLKHVFDGDAFIHAYSIRGGKVRVRARFVETPQRLEELEQGRMIYSEYGTLPPAPPKGAPKPKFRGKNQPSVNIVPWDGRLLGLSEGGHPSELDPETLAFRSYWDYYGTLPPNVSHTAHPKYDVETGLAYTYGLVQGPSMALMVYRMEKNGKLTELYNLPQRGFFMIHDMMMTKDQLIFAIPPMKYSLGDMLSGKATPAMALKFYEKEPLRYIIMSKDGKAEPITIELPANTVYHHGNAFTQNGNLIVDSCLSPDNSVSEMLNEWTHDKVSDYIQTSATRLELDLVKREVVNRSQFGEGQDFPRFDIRRSGEELRYLYAMENGVPNDPVAFDRIVRHDLKKGHSEGIKAKKGRVMGEAIFVSKPGSNKDNDGWVVNLMYDANRNESCIEMHDANSLEFVARAWLGTHLPLGFHGNFVPGWHIA